MVTDHIADWINSFSEVFWGVTDNLFYALLLLIILDYITGVCVAIHQKRLSSKIGFKGISKKIVVFSLVSLSHILDGCLGLDNHTLRTTTTLFYLINESMSILENADILGLPIPNKLKAILAQFDEKQK